MARQFEDFSAKFPRRALNLQNCEECLGDHLFNCKNVIGFVSSNSEHSKWIERSDAPMHSYDIVQSGNPQWCLEQITGDNTYAVHFSMYCNHSKHLLYCSDCLTCDQAIGCVSLRNKKYCILNREYPREEYEAIARSLLASMKERGEFGEFFPVRLSPFGYNETNAGEMYPLTKEEVQERGWHWRDTHPSTTGRETIAPDALPEGIADVEDSILEEILACTACGKNYRIIAQELDFYRRMNVPLPRRCPDCRYRERLARRTPFTIFERTCAKCSKEIQTTYAPERPEKVLCEECYLASVY